MRFSGFKARGKLRKRWVSRVKDSSSIKRLAWQRLRKWQTDARGRVPCETSNGINAIQRKGRRRRRRRRQ